MLINNIYWLNLFLIIVYNGCAKKAPTNAGSILWSGGTGNRNSKS